MTEIKSRKRHENLTAKNLKPKVQILVIRLTLISQAFKSRNLRLQQICQVAHKQQIHHRKPADLVVAKSVAIKESETDHCF